jgi:hypothetical protein
MAGATIRCQICGGGAHLGRVRRQPGVARRTVGSWPTAPGSPASVDKIVPSALGLPPAGVRHECRGAGEFQLARYLSVNTSRRGLDD